MSHKALIAMSGGVDSSVAALLMRQSGWDCVGCTMRLFENEDVGLETKACCSLDAVEDARSVAVRLGMPYYVFNFTADFREKVIGKFVDCYFAGATPNPCIDCNRYLKFDRLYERAKALGCDAVVTGHYARIGERNGLPVLKKGLDPDKDQSYVLYHLTAEQLRHTRFPVGELTKPEVRALAEEHGFLNAHRPDSQDICFAPDGDYAKVIETFSGRKSEPGAFVTPDGKVLGTHKGVIHYTLGQRKGLGIASTAPLYVVAIRPETNEVVLSHGEGLFTDTVTVRDLNLPAGEDFSEPKRVKAKIRYRHPEQPCTAVRTDEDTLILKFDTPQRAVTRGQSAVLYDGDDVLGGGTIDQAARG